VILAERPIITLATATRFRIDSTSALNLVMSPWLLCTKAHSMNGTHHLRENTLLRKVFVRAASLMFGCRDLTEGRNPGKHRAQPVARPDRFNTISTQETA
jgi:hypothetical protein